MVGGWWRVQGVCIGRMVVNECVCWEGGGECRGMLGGWWRVQGVCVGRVVM